MIVGSDEIKIEMRNHAPNQSACLKLCMKLGGGVVLPLPSAYKGLAAHAASNDGGTIA